MKLRDGNVSNSSSSSFYIDIKGLSQLVKNAIRNHCVSAKINNWLDEDGMEISLGDVWAVENTKHGDVLHCNTIIDNFDLRTWITDGLSLPTRIMSKEDMFSGGDEEIEDLIERRISKTFKVAVLYENGTWEEQEIEMIDINKHVIEQLAIESVKEKFNVTNACILGEK